MEQRLFARCPVFLVSFVLLLIVKNQTACPTRCLCYLHVSPRNIVCAKQGLENFPQNVSNLVEHLDLSHNLIGKITNDINHLVDLKYLNLANNRLDRLPDDLQGLKNLRRLDLSNNLIFDVQSIASVTQLTSLTVLYLSGNGLSELNGLFNEALQALDASKCEIREFNNRSLEGLPALTTLTLAENPLKTIDAPSSEKLRWLDLSSCLLNYLQPDTFSNFPELEDLRLANNPTLVFSTRRSTLTHNNLKKLDVSKCNLDRPGLHGLPLLNQARLSHNVIRILPNRIFVKNRHLTQLYLASNGLDQLYSNTFEGLVKLQILDLSANTFEGNFHWLTFQENLDLRVLNLSFNALYRLPNFTTSAVTVDLSSNLIDDATGSALPNMYRIRNLDLSYNRLQGIPAGLKSSTLRVLDLKGNRLVELKDDDLTDLPSLQKLDLTGNRLTEAMKPETFRNNVNLRTILLGDNPWRCDCQQLYVTFEFLTNRPSRTHSSTLICQSPANVSGYTWETACYDSWNKSLEYQNNRTWGLVLISLLTTIVFCGSIVSIRHTLKIKRQAAHERQQLERAEARERLRLLQRRSQRSDDHPSERSNEPRIHPMELLGPPSYEEAVQMPRLAHSLDDLGQIVAGPSKVLGSVDNLRAKKRRPRRVRKRALSEDDLLRRQERREERIRRRINDERGNLDEEFNRPMSQAIVDARTRRRSRAQSVCEVPVESSSGRDRPRPQTPGALKKKRSRNSRNGHSTDDEDSEPHISSSKGSVRIREFRREPRSGYRESTGPRNSDS